MTEWICDICDEIVEQGEAMVRIAADSAISDGDGGCESLTNREVLLFAIFHSECVVSTYSDTDYDGIQYIDEARYLLAEAPLCDDCHAEVHPKTPKLVMLRGGLP